MSQVITKCIDYTGTFDRFESYSGFCEDVVKSLRHAKPAGEQPLLLVVDAGDNLGDRLAVLVGDHLNLTGGSPLTGPNDPAGPRFPVINDVYFVPLSQNVEQVVVAGLKPGIEPTKAEIAMITKLGAQIWSHNTVQTMLVAAHAGFRVLAFVVSANSPEQKDQVRDLLESFLKRENLAMAPLSHKMEVC